MEREVLENIFVTAIEGGSNYWYFIPSKETKKVREAVPKTEEPSLSMAIFKAVYEKGVEVDVHDVENPQEKLGTISMETMEKRLDDLELNLDYGWAIESEYLGDGDASSSDVCFQYIVMGDVWYS